MAESLAKGEIDSMPTGSDEKSLPCKYCDYKAVCSTPDRKDAVIIKDCDNEKLLTEIKAEDETPATDGQQDERN